MSVHEKPEQRRLYITIPAAVTGDLWHLSAALNLVRIPELKAIHQFDRDVCVVFAVDERAATVDRIYTDKNDDRTSWYDQRNNGAMTFNFLKNQGFKPMIAVLAGDKVPKETVKLEALMAEATSEDLDDLYDDHQRFIYGDHVDKVPSCPNFETVLRIMREKANPFRTMGVRDLMHTSTSITTSTSTTPAQSTGVEQTAPTDKKPINIQHDETDGKSSALQSGKPGASTDKKPSNSRGGKPNAPAKDSEPSTADKKSAAPTLTGKEKPVTKNAKSSGSTTQGKTTPKSDGLPDKKTDVPLSQDGNRVLPYVMATTLFTQLLLDVAMKAGPEVARHTSISNSLKLLSGCMSDYHADVKKETIFNPEHTPPLFMEPEHEKIEDLVKKAIGKLGDVLSHDMFKDKDDIIFYNHRENKSVNRQTNSSPDIFRAFRANIAEKRPKTGVVVINTGGDPLKIEPDSEGDGSKKGGNKKSGNKKGSSEKDSKLEDWPTLDLYNKGEKDWHMPGLNPLATCAFFAAMHKLQQKELWESVPPTYETLDNKKPVSPTHEPMEDKKPVSPTHEQWDENKYGVSVHKLKKVFGIFSGRTGSVDVAAFNGVNTFWWDEPWIEWAAGNQEAVKSLGPIRDPESLEPELKRQNFCKTQIPQCLRTLQMHCFTAIGLPEYTGNLNQPWSYMQEPFKRWLAEESPLLTGALGMHYKLPHTDSNLPNIGPIPKLSAPLPEATAASGSKKEVKAKSNSSASRSSSKNRSNKEPEPEPEARKSQSKASKSQPKGPPKSGQEQEPMPQPPMGPGSLNLWSFRFQIQRPTVGIRATALMTPALYPKEKCKM